MGNDEARVRVAVERFDAANAEDPNHEEVNGRAEPKELVYAQRMSACLRTYAPNASESLRLAVRAQHIRRWTIPRSDFPPGRHGYRRWRTRLGVFHAEVAGGILRELGFEDATITRVQSLLRKERLKADPDAQTLEDVACLVFLEHYAPRFASQHDEVKLLSILRKTWRKMSERGRSVALESDLDSGVRRLVAKATAADSLLIPDS